MKKKLLFLLMPLLMGLTSCVLYNGQGKPGKSSSKAADVTPSSESSGSSGSSASVTPPDPTHHDTPEDAQPGATITIYLVFGQYGKLDGEFVNTSEASLFLENTKKVTNAVVGSDLPGADRVTSSVEGSLFKAWVLYKNDGKLTSYTKVPAIDNAILYASFGHNAEEEQQGGGSSSGEGSSTESTYKGSTSAEENGTGFGLRFLGAHYTYMAGEYAQEYQGFQQYRLSNRAFKRNQEFTLYDFGSGGAWVVNVDPYSFGGDSGSSTEWQKYLSNDGTKYTVLQDFNVSEVFIKIKNNEDQIYFALGA